VQCDCHLFLLKATWLDLTTQHFIRTNKNATLNVFGAKYGSKILLVYSQCGTGLIAQESPAVWTPAVNRPRQQRACGYTNLGRWDPGTLTLRVRRNIGVRGWLGCRFFHRLFNLYHWKHLVCLPEQQLTQRVLQTKKTKGTHSQHRSQLTQLNSSLLKHGSRMAKTHTENKNK